MALLKTSVKLIIREHAAYKFSGPLLALGVPEIYATYSEISDWFTALAGQQCPLKPSEAKLTVHPHGPLLGWVSADTFFKSLNLSDIVTIDIPGCEHSPDIIHDLNEPFPESLTNRFGLIVDPGTIEHVFDMKTCLSNVVRALKIGGVVIHQVPIYSYNGGYYSVNPNVMHDFYSANGFDELKSYIIMWDRYWPYTGVNRVYEYSDALLGPRHALADKDQCRYSPMLLFFARKIKDLPGVAVPVQFSGNYKEAVNRSNIHGSPSTAFKYRIAEMIFRFLRTRVAGLVHKYLPFHMALYYWQTLERNEFRYKTRKQSFWM